MIPVEYICFLNSSGYSQAAQDTIVALHRSKKFDVRVICLHGSPSKNAFSKTSFGFFSDLCKKPRRIDAVQIFHCIPEKQKRIARLRKAVSFATFETYRPPESWVSSLNNMDAVICPSKFNFSIFAHAGVKRPLFHIPHTIDTQRWNPFVKPMRQYSRYTFMFIGTWRKRKGWPHLVEAWMREFCSTDQTQLLIHTDKADIARRDIARIRREIGLDKKDTAPIIIEDTVIDDLALPSYFKSAHCLVSPSLGEGFGLPPLQCMALKIPVIATDFSGCQDYANNETCAMISPSGFLVHDCLDNIPQFRGRKWPRITAKSVQIAMREAFDNRGLLNPKVEVAYDNVRSNFNDQITVDRFTEMMESVFSEREATTQSV